jgi:hypothetical protein
VAALQEADVHRHAPLLTLLRYGKKMREVQLTVRLRASFTEVGTLELWCESPNTPHRWRLQFELRGEETQAAQRDDAKYRPAQHGAPVAVMPEAAVESAVQNIREVFGASAEGGVSAAGTLTSRLEAALGVKREAWPIATVRLLSDALIEVSAGRKQSAQHEARWLNLAGFCLRPGFGFPGDEARVRAMRNVASAGLVFADDLPCRVELLALLRRIAGGLNASEQQALYRQHTDLTGTKKS